MAAEDVLDQLRKARIVPVVRTADVELAELAVAWLAEAGFRTFEITLTIPGAVDFIRRLVDGTPYLVGAGTVMSVEDASRCLDAGARFIVSPAVVSELPPYAGAAGAATMLGAMTPTEVRAARLAGADAVKIFPASSAGGPAHIKALRAVFPDVPLVPTGGIGIADIGDYIAAGAALVGVGGKLIDEASLRDGEREKFLLVARHALASV
ncbi:MAG: 2-dehydro-3-deoxyphosphogluconate aldolase [Rhodospirillaceae bacterium]|nr:2-dehydro-3-deoxyphosphogluconate aldolase [Rhodospirillaceae bacterium]